MNAPFFPPRKPDPPRADADGEAARLKALFALQLLDTAPEASFDAITRSARRLVRTPIALISLVDDHRQWFKAQSGLALSETTREDAFSAQALTAPGMMIVRDARLDPRFADNPLVIGPPYICFYAGVPLLAGSGDRHAVGTLCVIDRRPRTLNADEADSLRDLAHLVEGMFEARGAALAAAGLAAERERIQDRLERSGKQFKQAERMANIGSWRLTLADQRTEWSDQVYAIHGLPVSAQPSLQGALEFYPAASQVAEALAKTIATGQPFDIETDLITDAGERRRVRSRGELELHNGSPVAVIGVLQDITERHALEQALRRAATLDVLTGLANRAGFNAALDTRIAEARAADSALVLLLIDLDHFKPVNDYRGHLAGDALLCAIAARLQDPGLAGSFAARLGGDEFVLVVTAPALLADLPALLRSLLSDLACPVLIGEHLVEISSSIGVCRLDATIADRSELLHRADVALYEAKRDCRGSARIHGDRRAVVVANRGKKRLAR